VREVTAHRNIIPAMRPPAGSGRGRGRGRPPGKGGKGRGRGGGGGGVIPLPARSTNQSYSWVVASSGGDGTTIASAIGAGKIYNIIKQGTYSSNNTYSIASAKYMFEPNVILNTAGKQTITGDHVSLEYIGNITAEKHDIVAQGCCLKNLQGFGNVDDIDVRDFWAWIDGGGYNFDVAQAGSSTWGIRLGATASASYGVVTHCRISGSTFPAIYYNNGSLMTGSFNNLLSGEVQIRTVNCSAIGNQNVNGFHARILNAGNLNKVLGNVTNALNADISASSDNNILAGGIVERGAATSVTIAAGSDNNVVVGMRLDGTISDAGTGNTKGDNNTGAIP